MIVTETGSTYERETIVEWWQTNDTDPITNTVLTSKQLVQNISLCKLIEDHVTLQSKARGEAPSV